MEISNNCHYYFIWRLISENNIKEIDFIYFKQLDKIVHFIFYFSLTITLITSLHVNSKMKLINNYLLTFLIVLGYGIFMEILQSFLTINRTADILDVIANSIGILVGLLIFTSIKNTKLLKYL